MAKAKKSVAIACPFCDAVFETPPICCPACHGEVAALLQEDGTVDRDAVRTHEIALHQLRRGNWMVGLAFVGIWLAILLFLVV